jgi:hypothetical protein
MSQREQHVEAKRLLSEIRHELDTAPLTPKQRSELQFHAAQLADSLLDYPKAKQVLSQIQHELDTAPLTQQGREQLQLRATALAGKLFHPWFPVSWSRRLIMVAIVLFGLQQAWTGNYEPMVFWLLLPLFSPRIVGECALAIGRVAGRFRQ